MKFLIPILGIILSFSGEAISQNMPQHAEKLFDSTIKVTKLRAAPIGTVNSFMLTIEGNSRPQFFGCRGQNDNNIQLFNDGGMFSGYLMFDTEAACQSVESRLESHFKQPNAGPVLLKISVYVEFYEQPKGQWNEKTIRAIDGIELP